MKNISNSSQNEHSYEGGGQNLNKINPLFKDVKEYNKYLLSLIGIFVLLLSGIISYNYTNTSYAKWSSSIESKNVLKLSVKKPNIDKSGANVPKLTNNMIPVYYDETNSVWRKADKNNSIEEYKWYDYDNKMWANAVTINSSNFYPLKNNGKIELPEFILNNSNTITLSTTTKTAILDYSTNTVTFEGDATKYNMSDIYIFAPGESYSATYYIGAYNLNDKGILEPKYTSVSSGSVGNLVGMSISEIFDEMIPTVGIGEFAFIDKNGIYIAGQLINYNSGTTSNTYNVTYKEYILDFDTVYCGNSYTHDITEAYIYLENTDRVNVDNAIGKYITYRNNTYHVLKINKISKKEYSLESGAKLTFKVYSGEDLESNNEQVVDNNKIENGAEIPMSAINTMWVWIPRYTYTYFNGNSPKNANVKFESGVSSSGTITCRDAINQSNSAGELISQICEDSENQGLKVGTSTYTHPAFTFGSDELTGIWVGKFGNTGNVYNSTDDFNIKIRPYEVFPRDYYSISEQFKCIRQMEKANNIYGFPQSSSTTFNWNGTLTGDTNNIDTHMIKNIEWGAVFYLTYSKYGFEQWVNSNTYYGNEKIDGKYGYTARSGCGSESRNTCGKYDTDNGKQSSTTGNIYGIYDMNMANTTVFVMGNMVDSSSQFQVASAGNWSTTLSPLDKYYDSYTYDEKDSSTGSNNTYTRGRLGDAMLEVQYIVNRNKSMPHDDLCWISRGDNYLYNGWTGSSSSLSHSVLTIQ